MSQADLAFIVVAYGHAATLPATLSALVQQTRPARNIIVIDNGDGSSGAAAECCGPTVDVLRADRNLGFAGGCNLGASMTRASHLAFVNPDVILQPDWTAAIMTALADPTVGIAGSKLLYPDGRIQHAGGRIHWPRALTDHHGYGASDGALWSAPATVDYVTGAALALRREVWDQVAGFDANFFPAYFEEVDLCLRVAALGYTIRYEPAAIGIHQEASALGKTSERYYRLYHLNRLRLLWKQRDDAWLLSFWLPSELAHLQTTASDAELGGLLWAYRRWQALFLAREPHPEVPHGWDQPPAEGRVSAGELGWALDQLQRKSTLQPLPFRSRLPLVGRLRGALNRIATEAYLRPLIQQQNDYNAALLDLARALERQRRAADGAVLAQAMLLAKLLRRL